MSGHVRPQFMIGPGWAVQSGFPIEWFGLPTTGAEALRGRTAVCGFVPGCLQILGAVLQEMEKVGFIHDAQMNLVNQNAANQS